MEVPTGAGTGRITRQTRGLLFLIGIDRPAKRNAFDWAMLNDLARAFTEYEQDSSARCAVLYAEGEHFTGGLDLAEVSSHFRQGQMPIPAGCIDPFGVHGPSRTKPLVCAVQGYCLTLGIELALAADVVVAASDTRFAQIEVRRGIFPFGGATLRFVQAAGWGNAMRYLLTGDEFDADEARRIGIVQEVVAPGMQLARAVELADTIAAQAPLGVRATLASARLAIDEGFQAAGTDLKRRAAELMNSEDAHEGLLSFRERRPGQYKGK